MVADERMNPSRDKSLVAASRMTMLEMDAICCTCTGRDRAVQLTVTNGATVHPGPETRPRIAHTSGSIMQIEVV